VPQKPLKNHQSKYKNITEAMARAYLSGHYTLAEVGLQFSVNYATVSRAVKTYEEAVKCKPNPAFRFLTGLLPTALLILPHSIQKKQNT